MSKIILSYILLFSSSVSLANLGATPTGNSCQFFLNEAQEQAQTPSSILSYGFSLRKPQFFSSQDGSHVVLHRLSTIGEESSSFAEFLENIRSGVEFKSHWIIIDPLTGEKISLEGIANHPVDSVWHIPIPTTNHVYFADNHFIIHISSEFYQAVYFYDYQGSLLTPGTELFPVFDFDNHRDVSYYELRGHRQIQLLDGNSVAENYNLFLRDQIVELGEYLLTPFRDKYVIRRLSGETVGYLPYTKTGKYYPFKHGFVIIEKKQISIFDLNGNPLHTVDIENLPRRLLSRLFGSESDLPNFSLGEHNISVSYEFGKLLIDGFEQKKMRRKKIPKHTFVALLDLNTGSADILDRSNNYRSLNQIRPDFDFVGSNGNFFRISHPTTKENNNSTTIKFYDRSGNKINSFYSDNFVPYFGNFGEFSVYKDYTNKRVLVFNSEGNLIYSPKVNNVKWTLTDGNIKPVSDHSFLVENAYSRELLLIDVISKKTKRIKGQSIAVSEEFNTFVVSPRAQPGSIASGDKFTGFQVFRSNGELLYESSNEELNFEFNTIHFISKTRLIAYNSVTNEVILLSY